MRLVSALALALLPAAAVVACGSQDVGGRQSIAEGCAPGAREACACSSGPEGFRSCLETRTFGECQCPIVTPGADVVPSEDAGCTPTARAYVDADGDGFGVGEFVDVCTDASGAIPPGYASKAGDCDDADARAHPDQKTPQAGARKGSGGGDFDCDGTEEPTIANKGLCTSDCTHVAGWVDEVAPCGTTAAYVDDCTKMGAACVTVTSGREQHCL